MRTLQQIIQDQLEIIPAPIREVALGGDWRRKAYDIGKKHELHIDQLGFLEQEVYLMIIGLTPAREFPDALQENVGLSPEETNSIITDLNEQIFSNLREFLSKMDTLGDDLAKEDLGMTAEEVNDIPSRDDILKEIEDIDEIGAPPVVISPISQKLSVPTTSIAQTTTTTVAAPKETPIAKAMPTTVPLSQALPTTKPSMGTVPIVVPSPSTPTTEPIALTETVSTEAAPSAPASDQAPEKAKPDLYREPV